MSRAQVASRVRWVMKDESRDQAGPKQRVKGSGSRGPPDGGGDMRAELWTTLRLSSSRLAKRVVERRLQASSVRLCFLVRTRMLQQNRDISFFFKSVRCNSSGVSPVLG